MGPWVLINARWYQFLLDYKGPVDESLDGYIKWADKRIAQLTGTHPSGPPPGTPYIEEGVDPNSLGLAVLTAEITRLESLWAMRSRDETGGHLWRTRR